MIGFVLSSKDETIFNNSAILVQNSSTLLDQLHVQVPHLKPALPVYLCMTCLCRSLPACQLIVRSDTQTPATRIQPDALETAG